MLQLHYYGSKNVLHTVLFLCRNLQQLISPRDTYTSMSPWHLMHREKAHIWLPHDSAALILSDGIGMMCIINYFISHISIYGMKYHAYDI